MADTRQIVRWALERQCIFRNGDNWCEDVWHENYDGAPTDGTAWLSAEGKEPFRVMRGGWCMAAETVCASAARRQARADAGSRTVCQTDDDDDGFLAAMFGMLYMPCGFRVVCEV